MCRVLCMFLVLVACVCGHPVPIVDTSVGQIIGLKDEFTKFLGVPYAVVDVRDPFGPAKPHKPFKTPYYANKIPDICPQLVNGIPQGNIQCLNLNIYGPLKTKENGSLPVMVFIHGGAFKDGDANLNTYSPVFLVKHGVIVVSMHYRLGPYGFQCLEQDEYTNQGLKDQSLALKWVIDNIKYFGGDENNVLLFGHSAGSGSVEFHLLSNEEKIYKKVILQSLQMVSPLMVGSSTKDVYLNSLAARLGVDSNNRQPIDLIKELSKLRMDFVINATQNDEFRPCIDGTVIGSERNNLALKDIKIIIGNAAREATFLFRNVADISLLRGKLNEEFSNLSRRAVARVENFYSIGSETDNVLDFCTDLFFNYPVARAIRHYLRNNATVYRYVFTYDGERNLIKVRDGIQAEGATHGDELGYLYDSEILGEHILERDQYVIDTITTLWTNFAKYGEPTPSQLPTLRQWPKVDKASHYIEIGTAPIVGKGYRKDYMAFWDSFYEDFGIYSKGYRFEEESQLFYCSTDKHRCNGYD